MCRTEKSTTNLDLDRDRQIDERRENIRTDEMNRDRTCASMQHPSPCRDKTMHLTTELSTSTKIDASGTMTRKTFFFLHTFGVYCVVSL